MSKYMRKYADYGAYKNDRTRPTDHSVVSVAGEELAIEGRNVIVPYRSASLELGDEKVFDLAEGVAKILKHGTYHAATFDSSRYMRSEAFFLVGYADRDVFVYKKCIGSNAVGSEQWAADNEYKVTLDLTKAGGFSYECSPTTANISGSCTWAAGDTVASVVAKLTKGSGLDITAIGTDAIRFKLSTYYNGEITFSNVSNATVLDCSFSARIGVNGTEGGRHAGFQGQDVKTIFPTLEYMAPSSVCICESGYDSASCTNAMPDNFKRRYSTSGAAAFAAESEPLPMRESVWDALATDGDATHKALYDKYGGSYDAYLLSRRMKKDTCRGVGSTVREQAMAYTYALANCYFTDAEGNTKHVYPAAALCAECGMEAAGYNTGFEAGNWYLPGCTELAGMLSPENVSTLNAAIATATGGQQLAGLSQWAVGEYNGANAWSYHEAREAVRNSLKYSSCQVRALLASRHV